MSRKTLDSLKSTIQTEIDPLECPFREFRDNELQPDAWGLSTAAFRAHSVFVKATAKPPPHDVHYIWTDEQTQPLPRSVRRYLHGWIKAEKLAVDRWNADVIVFEENNGGRMSVADMQLSHAQVLFRSSFCRKVLSACFILERVDSLMVEHQWELFTCSFAPEGWRPKYHIYSHGLKPGGGAQHKPLLSKTGCYLVRLFYLGTWRCVWVSDQVPVDTSGSPLLPFSPLLTRPPAKPGSKLVPAAVTADVVYLWPLLLTKALLKLAAPDMNSDEDSSCVEDELMPEFDIMHALTGGMNIGYIVSDLEDLWTRIITEVQLFSWDDDEETQPSTVKSRSTKKPTAKELASVIRKPCMTYAILKDTKDLPPYHIPGITPGHEMCLLIMMARDLPLKKPLPEPEVALWKYYRWVDWAKGHGLYAAYDCPRTRFLKVNGLMKLSYAPHLLDVQSTESITYGFIEEHVKSTTGPGKDDESEYQTKKKKPKEQQKSALQAANLLSQQLKEELREWIQFASIDHLVKNIQVVYYPSSFNFTSSGSNPPYRLTKAPAVKVTDILAPKHAPLYFQLDGPEKNKLRMSLTALHPRILLNSGIPIVDYIEPAYVVVEKFEWFKDLPLAVPKAFLTTRGYESLEIDFDPGRHFFRIWTHSRMNWHIMIISESTLLLGTRDVIQGAAVRDCPWASKFLLNLGQAFSNWIKISRTSPTVIYTDRDFFSQIPNGGPQPACQWLYYGGGRSAVEGNELLAGWAFFKYHTKCLAKVVSDGTIGGFQREVVVVLTSYSPDLTWDKEVIGYDRHHLHWMFRQALQSLLSKTLNHTEWKVVCNVLRKYFCDPDFGFPKKPRPPKSLREIANLDICDCVMPEVEEVECLEEQLEEIEQEVEVEVKPLVTPDVMTQLLKPAQPPLISHVCELATEELPCGILKDEREKMIRKHEAAVILQAHWRGTWARRCLKSNITFTTEVTKYLQDRVFGTLDALSMLMNEFFAMWPGAKYAYSVSSALGGVYGLQQHTGITQVTSKCKWIPFFQGVYYCHAPVKVHFDVQSSIVHSTLAVYDNDTELQLPQAYNTHTTFDFAPNYLGYTVQGHGTLTNSPGIMYDAHWQLTVMSCIDGAFHICDNEEPCKEMPMPSASKLHIDEIYLPNRRNVVGGIQISVTKHEFVSFRAAATSPDLEIVAVLRSISPNGGTEEISKCSGKGEINWPYIRLEPQNPKKSRSNSAYITGRELINTSARSLMKTQKAHKATTATKSRSIPKVSLMQKTNLEPKLYSIEVVCPTGWPLTLAQWKRVDEVRNSQDSAKLELQSAKKTVKEKEKPGKAGAAKEKEKVVAVAVPIQQPQTGDACVELECATAVGGGAVAKRDDDRDLAFAKARKSWDAKEPGRNQKGALIRKQFRTEFLEIPTSIPSESVVTVLPDDIESTVFEETEGEETKDEYTESTPGPLPLTTPVSESGIIEPTVSSEEETLYQMMPDQLRDKFTSLHFLPFCMKEKTEDQSVIETPDMAEAAKNNRLARISAAMERMRELQVFNEEHVLGRQRYRCQVLEKLCVDATSCQKLIEVMEQREEAIAQEVLNRNLSATKKKIEARKK